MATVTKEDITNTFISLYEAQTHATYTFSADSEGNVTQSEPIYVQNEVTPELEQIIKTFADAVIQEFKSKGIDIGDSLATKLDVG